MSTRTRTRLLRAGLLASTLSPLLLAALLLAGAGSAQAQVAAPSLVPFGFVTENPAVMQWGAPSRVGVAYGQFQQTLDPPVGPALNDTLYSAGIRLVGNYLSAAVDGTHTETSGVASFTANSDTLNGALGVRLGPMVTFGVAQNSRTVKVTGDPSPESDQVDAPGIGVSVRLGEWFFLGAGEAREYLSQTVTGVTPGTLTTYRDIEKYGIGIRTGTTVLMHLEYYYIGRTNYNDPILPNTIFFSGKETQGVGVAEFIFGPILVGYRQSHVDRNSGEPTTDLQVADLGWAPRLGLSVTLHGEVQQEKAAAFTNTTTTYAVAAAYLF